MNRAELEKLTPIEKINEWFRLKDLQDLQQRKWDAYMKLFHDFIRGKYTYEKQHLSYEEATRHIK